MSAAPLLLRHGAETPHSDVQELAELVALTTPLLDFGSTAPRRPFLHRSCTEVVGNIAITNAAHTGVFARLDASPEVLIHLPLAGLGFNYQADGRSWRVCPGQRGFYLPGHPALAEAGPGAGLIYNLDQALLARHACFHASRPGLEVDQIQRRLQQPLSIDLLHPTVAAAWQGLKRLLIRFDPEPGLTSCLQDAIYSASARMLLPDLF